MIKINFLNGDVKVFEDKDKYDPEHLITGDFLVIFTNPIKYVYPLSKIETYASYPPDIEKDKGNV